MEITSSESHSRFTYTVGITCERARDQGAEGHAAVEVLKHVPMGRWPISLFPPSKTYFTADARVFYERAVAPLPVGLLRKLFGGQLNGSFYLVGMLYHEPESRALYQKGIIEDFESSTGIFIRARSSREAIAWAETVAEILLRKLNGDVSLDWKALGYHCWIEEDPRAFDWKHCLSFLQKVKVGELPNFDKMGTAAYKKWTVKNEIKDT